MNNNDRYSTPFYIPSYMVDIRSRMKAVSFMEIAQELAGKGAEMLGMSDPDLKPLNAVWVLARMHVEFVRMPRRDDEVMLHTWHKGLKGIQYLRDYRMDDKDGGAMVLSTSSWVVMEMSERRILRRDVLDAYIPSEPQCAEHAVEAPCVKLVLPKGVEVEAAGEHVVRYSDVDYNLHTNNTKYVLWALDCLPEEVVVGGGLREFDINWNKESHSGECISLVRVAADGFWYVEGRNAAGEQCFISRFLFSEPDCDRPSPGCNQLKENE